MKRHIRKAVHHIKKHAKKVPPAVLIAAVLMAGYLIIAPLFLHRVDSVSMSGDMLDRPAVIGMGGFVGSEGYEAFGAVTLYKVGKSYFIRLEDNFKIEEAEDLGVYLSTSMANSRVPSVYLAPLFTTSGAQTYEVPLRTNMKKYDSVSILRSGVELYGRAVIEEDEL